MRLIQFVKIAAALTVVASAAANPAVAGNCGNGVGNGNATCGRNSGSGIAIGSVAPLPALGTGIPGLLVLAGGLVALARRRR